MDRDARREARAQEAADRAYAKSQRSWFARHKILTALGALLLLGVVGSALGGQSGGSRDTLTSGSGSPPSASKSSAKSAPAAATLGTPVRDGKFEFTVKSVKDGPRIIGSEQFGTKPQGRFVLVDVKVENVGDAPQTFFGNNQYLYIGDKKYAADTEAAIYLDDAKSLLEDINPGNSLDGVSSSTSRRPASRLSWSFTTRPSPPE